MTVLSAVQRQKYTQRQLSNWCHQKSSGFYLTNLNLENILKEFGIACLIIFLNEDILLATQSELAVYDAIIYSHCYFGKYY